MAHYSKPILVVSLIASLLLHLLTLARPAWLMDGQQTASVTILEAHLRAAELPIVPVEERLPKALAEPDAVRPARDPAIPVLVSPNPGIEPAAIPEHGDELPQANPALLPASTGAASPSEIAPAAPDVTGPLPRSGRILYSQRRGENGPVVGRSVHEWQHDGQRYQLRATREATGLTALFQNARESKTSEGFFVNGELRPEHYTRERTGDPSENFRFDWSNSQVTLRSGQVAGIGAGTQDSLTMVYQLMRLLQRGYKQIVLVDNSRLDRAELRLLSDESLQVGAGTFAAWHIRIGSLERESGVTEVWLGKELLGLLVLIRQSDLNGNVTEFAAEEIAYEGK